jgi:3-hydroxyacyl-CoA dehydrogenase
MFWADQMGLETALDKIKGYHAAGQEVLAPAPLIERLVAEGHSFADLDKPED